MSVFDKYSRISLAELKNLGKGTLVRFSEKPVEIYPEGWDWTWVFRQEGFVAAVFLLREVINKNEGFVAEYFKGKIPELFKSDKYFRLVDWEGSSTIYGSVINQSPVIVMAHFIFPQVVQNLLDKKRVEVDEKKISVDISFVPKKDLDRRIEKIIELLKIKKG
jgi:hypothetical protein